MKTKVYEQLDWTMIEFVFKKGVPGDRYFYHNALEVPPVFGCPISVYPLDDAHVSVTAFLKNECLVERIVDYVKNHRREKYNTVKF